jgi:anti-sigma regulatory factor (Ser/Thr protein kinase)
MTVTEFSSVPESTKQAREWLRGLLSHNHDDAELVLTELSTNAFIHGQRPVTCRVEVGDDILTIHIDQPATGPFEPPTTYDPTAVGGRGLKLVGAIATQWGQSFKDGVLTVWATLPNDPAG